jgi:hypothetical protein
MSGFAARRGRSLGIHDPITVRALAVDDSCVVCVDASALDEDACSSIRAGAPFPDERVIVTAIHTHGGPAVMRGGLGEVSEAARDLMVSSAVRAAALAAHRRQPATLEYADAGPVPVATDRRRGGLPSTARLQALRWMTPRGDVIAWFVTYPCHPVVLGPRNRELTADYPASLRVRLEAAAPGSVALFATGCAGDINVGHSATASYSSAPDPRRTFEEAERIGALLADGVVRAHWTPATSTGVAGAVDAASEPVTLDLEPLDTVPPSELARRWSERACVAPPDEAAVLDEWIQWAGGSLAGRSGIWTGSVSALRWDDSVLVFLPGEPFLATGTSIADRSASALCLVLGYANGCPGYLPTSSAYDEGGYEVGDAHRYYGMPAPFARGSAETIGDAAVRVMRRVERQGGQP